MGIFPTDIPFDESGLGHDRWHFQLSEPLNGHNCGALLENGRTVEPVMTRVLRRISGGMGSMLVGAMRVEGGPVVELGDCSSLKPAAVLVGTVKLGASDHVAAVETEKVDAELAQLAADIAALEAAETATAPAAEADRSTPAAVPAPEPASRDDGAAALSDAGKPGKGKK